MKGPNMTVKCDSCGYHNATHKLSHRYGSDYLCTYCAQGVVEHLTIGEDSLTILPREKG